jgi:glycosyltransferase involved in cell wall biosynthesis
MPSCVIIVENLPVPFDRRVWQEARSLTNAGWDVSVICPASDRYPKPRETIEGIDIYRHRLPLEAEGKYAFLLEYAAALFHETRLLFSVWRNKGFDVIQACNPPDLIFLVAAPYKLFGKRFVFDHHDVCPELYEAKFGRRGFFHGLLRLAEWLTYKTADVVIATNETYRSIAIERGGKRPEDVASVYSVPDRSRIRRVAPSAELRGDASVVLGYLGIIAHQDGVDHLVRAVHHLVADYGYGDVRAVVVGDGPALQSVKDLATDLGVTENVVFTGYLQGHDLLQAISSFDIGIIPDPVNPYNDKISMNKVFEYSALGIPSVVYDLSETKRLLGDAATYASEATPEGLARACLPLIENEALRREKGAAALALADSSFSWEQEAKKFIEAYERFVPGRIEVQHA